MFLITFRGRDEVEIEATRWERPDPRWFDFYDGEGVIVMTVCADEVLHVNHRRVDLESAAV